ncbi:YbjN domain-containing protein [Corallincola holothuriorum]|uniref:YbjN domain-containing protein n=1 Tax=Corallincola holothuriorum TaxID=2282215 RepID=A0A368NHC8_9GAMM|nr:YbjN domain-containing protein [Corallincola holothuriorum]RCU49972.1 YbjN domain-containing protein [Corallincola holothuriorum]
MMCKRLFLVLAFLLVPMSQVSAAPSKTQVNAALEVLQEAVKSMGPTLVSRFSLAELEQLLKQQGYKEVKVRESGSIVFNHDGTNYVLQLYDDGDLQLYFGVSGIRLTASAMNEWNRTKRLSRAYLDSDDDPGLEADLMANGGINEEIVSEFIKVFVNTSAPAFENFLRENGV